MRINNNCILLLLLTLSYLAIFLSLPADFEIIDEDSVLDTEEHLYIMLERVNIQTASRSELSELLNLSDQDISNILTYRRRHVIINPSFLLDSGLSRETIDNILPYIDFGQSEKLEYNLLSYLRYQDSTNNFRNINRINIKNNVYDLRLHHEYNTVNENTPVPLGGNLTIRRSPTGRFILGQFQINHGYGLLLSRGSFISQKPGFNTDYRSNRLLLSGNSRSYYSRSFFGFAYEKHLSNDISVLIFSSLKQIDVRLVDNAIDRVYIDEKYPVETALFSTSGAALHYTRNAFNISSSIIYNIAEYPFADSLTVPLSGSIASSYSLKQYLLFSELSYSNSSFANITGVKNSFGRFNQLLTFRYFSNGYNSLWGDYVSNSSAGTNEQGLFYKLEYRTRNYFLQSFGDIFHNLENNERYMDRNEGASWGLNAEKYGLFTINDMGLGLSYRQKVDKEWRNLSGITRYETRKREYLKSSWTQTNTRFLRTRLVFNYQIR